MLLAGKEVWALLLEARGHVERGPVAEQTTREAVGRGSDTLTGRPADTTWSKDKPTQLRPALTANPQSKHTLSERTEFGNGGQWLPVVRNGSKGSRSASRRRWVWGLLMKGQHEGHFLIFETI